MILYLAMGLALVAVVSTVHQILEGDDVLPAIGGVVFAVLFWPVVLFACVALAGMDLADKWRSRRK